jgi:hypothetical protein
MLALTLSHDRDGDEDVSFAASFAPSLLDPERAVPSCLLAPCREAAAKRYGIHRNNVTVSLINVLAAIYPAVRRITGPDFFQAMARFHVRTMPPRSPLLFEYGRDFADLIDRYEYARNMPWLADVARLERAWLDAYHVADAEPLSIDLLSTVAQEKLARLVFVAHPATRLVRSEHPAVTIFAMNRGDGPVEPVTRIEPEDALITRPGANVVVSHLPPGGYRFLSQLILGTPLGEAAAVAFSEAPFFDLARSIAGMIEAGAFTAIRQGD